MYKRQEDKVSGLRLGADDYLTKPFGINELMARVNSLIRRYTTLNPVAGSEEMCIRDREFSAKTVKQKEQPSIRHKLDQEKAQSKAQHKEKVKVKTCLLYTSRCV